MNLRLRDTNLIVLAAVAGVAQAGDKYCGQALKKRDPRRSRLRVSAATELAHLPCEEQ
jgi:hypothetical protein